MTMASSSVGTRPFPELHVSTPRLTCRPLIAADAVAVAAVFGERVAQRWLPVPRGYSVADADAWCTTQAWRVRAIGDGDHYGIIRRVDDRLVGLLWTRRTDWLAGSTEIAFVVRADTRGFGVAPEAVDVIALALLRQHGFHRVELRVVPGNLAARRVADKAGFTYEGLLRDAGHVHNGRVDLEVWSMVSADLRPAT